MVPFRSAGRFIASDTVQEGDEVEGDEGKSLTGPL